MSELYRHEGILQKYLKKYWYAITAAVVFSTLSNFMNLQLPKFMTILVDDVIINKKFDLIPSFILQLTWIFFLGGVFDLIRTLVTQYMSTNIIYNIRNDMFKALQHQSHSFFDKNRTGNLMSKTTADVNAVRNFLVNQFQNFIKNVITFIVIFLFVWQMNWIMALLFLSLTPPLYILMIWYRKRIRPASYEMYQARGILNSIIQENIAGVRVVKAFGRQRLELEKFLKQNEIYIEKQKKVVKLQSLYGPLSEFFTMAGSTIIVFVGAWLVLTDKLTLGDIVAVFAYFSMVYDPIRQIVNFFNQLAANRAALDRVNEILENRSEIVIPDKPIDPTRALGDLYLRLLKTHEIYAEFCTIAEGNRPGIYAEKRVSEEELLAKYREKTLFPSGVKSSAVENIGFRGDTPMIFTEAENITPVAKKMVSLIETPIFKHEFERIKSEFKTGREHKRKRRTILEFISEYFIYLMGIELLMQNLYQKLSDNTGIEIAELKKDPERAFFDYIKYLADSEKELKRIHEMQITIYSPRREDHIEIAKKYDKLLVEQGLLEPSRKETVMPSPKTTSGAMHFLKMQEEIIRKELEKLKKREEKRRRKKLSKLMKKAKKMGKDIRELLEQAGEPFTVTEDGKIELKSDEDTLKILDALLGEQHLSQRKEKKAKLGPISFDTPIDEICPTPVKVNNLRGHVVFDGVYFTYDEIRDPENINWALRNINLDVKPGETVAFLGATGSGKSTLINLIPRFYDATRGNIYIDGIDIRELDLKDYRQNIGIVSQEVFLFSRSIKDNISYGVKGKRRVKMEDIIAVAKIARIHDFIMSLPDGYDTIVGERGQTLSGGQKQRIAIARALLLDPRILILDDSLSAVDVDTEYEIQKALEKLFKGRTTFIITQRLSTIRNCDRIFVLDDGMIVEQGTHEELLELNGIYTKIYSTIFRKEQNRRAEVRAANVR